MKKVLVCALAALFLMATCLTAFAVDYTTTTTYINGDIAIQTTVTGTTSGDMYTYLAHTEDSATDDTIVYIDQKTSEGGNVVFSFTSDEVQKIADIEKITVKSGSSNESVATYSDDDISDAVRSVTVVVNYPDIDAATDTVYFAEEYAVGDSERVELTDIIIGNDYSWDETALNANIIIDDATRTVSVKDSADLDTETITIKVTKNVVITPPTVNAEKNSGRYDGYQGGKKAEKLTVFGKIDNIDNADEFGIILSTTPNAEDENRRKYPALFKGAEGTFAVQLVNIYENDTSRMELTTQTWYAWVYATTNKDDATTYDYGEMITFETAPSATVTPEAGE